MKSMLMSFLSRCKVRVYSKRHFSTESALSPSQHHEAMIKSGAIQYDPRQVRVAQEIDKLYYEIGEYSAPQLPDKPCPGASIGAFEVKRGSKSNDVAKPNLFQRLIGRAKMNKPVNTWTPPSSSSIPNSLYLWGGTGTGKTMLMDVLYESITNHKKQRVHFNTFMLDLYDEIHSIRQHFGGNNDHDPVPELSLNIANRSTILYLDEFQVTDVFEAVLLNRLFTSLYYYGVICFLTSNREPDHLYLNGLQRNEIFVPFLKLLKEKSIIIDLNTTNYRDVGDGYGYFVDNVEKGRESRFYFENAWKDIIANNNNNGNNEKMRVVQVMGGRELSCPRCIGDSATRFKFQELCASNKGSADYLALSKSFNTIFIENIPHFGDDAPSRNEMKRFIWLIDELYNGKNAIICLAADKPDKLLQTVNTDELKQKDFQFEEIFQFERCRKRLYEMQSIKYLKEAKGHNINNDDYKIP